MRVLILSCGTGGGHNAAASAMKEALEACGLAAVGIAYKAYSHATAHFPRLPLPQYF